MENANSMWAPGCQTCRWKLCSCPPCLHPTHGKPSPLSIPEMPSYLLIFAANITWECSLCTLQTSGDHFILPAVLQTLHVCGCRAHTGCCSLPGKVLVALSIAETKPCGTKLSWRKEEREVGLNTFEKLFLHVRKQMMILLMLLALFTALFSFKVFS